MTTVGIFLPLMRPSRLPKIVANIEATTKNYHIHVLASGEAADAAVEFIGPDLTLWRDMGGTWPARMNHGYWLTKEPYFFLGADDLKFHPGWLTYAMKAMQQIDGLVVVNDLQNPNGTSCLVSRRYVNMYGCIDGPGLIHPGYDHNYSDAELFETARVRGRMVRCSESVVEHIHWESGKAVMDDVYLRGQKNRERDRILYESRVHLWTEQPPSPRKVPKAPLVPAVVENSIHTSGASAYPVL